MFFPQPATLEEEAEDIVENEGYIFNKGYDEILEIYEV